MPEMRKDPITGHWSIIATERAKRPIKKNSGETDSGSNLEHDPECFFCYGNEDTTPLEVMTYRTDNGEPNSPGWDLRVVPNKYSALNLDEKFCVDNLNPFRICCYARGSAEVVIESPHHSLNTALFSNEQIELLLKAYKDRYIVLSQEKAIQYVSMFKNNGSPAGASLPHPHSQVIALPIIPPAIQNEIDGAEKYYRENNSCVYCDMLKNETGDGSRIVAENDDFIAFVPYASRTPFETWVMPKFHSAGYEKLSNTQIKRLAEIWKALLYKIYAGLENPPYNYYIHTSPVQVNTEDYYHWHMELIPKMTITAGFELGTGMFINVSIPEQNAEYLRSIVP